MEQEHKMKTKFTEYKNILVLFFVFAVILTSCSGKGNITSSNGDNGVGVAETEMNDTLRQSPVSSEDTEEISVTITDGNTETESDSQDTANEDKTAREDENSVNGKTMCISNVEHSVHFRTEPNENCKYHCDIPVGAEVLYLGDYNDTYAKIKYDGKEGYIKTIHLAKIPLADVEKSSQAETEIVASDSEKTEVYANTDSSANARNKTIVLDPGHGASSFVMSDDDKKKDGWTYREGFGWGEWRHWKSGTLWQDCEGTGCSKRAPDGDNCWYGIGRSNRDTEPAINLANALAAKRHLENMGYTVRLTRSTNSDNPSMSKRLSYCCPNNDTAKNADADLFVCLHTNATGNGKGRGSYYIALFGEYDQKGANEEYIRKGNLAGKCINDRIVSETSLTASRNGVYNGYPELVLFCMSPVPIAYMEIGYYDNSEDLAILNSETDSIGLAIAHGIDDYFAMS